MWGVDSPVTNYWSWQKERTEWIKWWKNVYIYFQKTLVDFDSVCILNFIFIITVGALHFCADVCPSCDHIVASHEYTFRVEGQYQVFPESNNVISIPSHRKSSQLSQSSKQEQITIPQSPSHFILPIHPSLPSQPSHLSQPSQPCHPSHPSHLSRPSRPKSS